MQKSYACAGFQSTPPVKAATDAIMSYDTAPGISIHAAREGGDEENPFEEEVAYAFQSTPPVKAATGDIIAGAALEIISIHAAREGGDQYIQHMPARPRHFNPRRP